MSKKIDGALLGIARFSLCSHYWGLHISRRKNGEYVKARRAAQEIGKLRAERDALRAEVERLQAQIEASPKVSTADAAKIILGDRWGGYGNHATRDAMFTFVHDQHGRHLIPMSGYDGVMQAGLQAIAALEGGDA